MKEPQSKEEEITPHGETERCTEDCDFVQDIPEEEFHKNLKKILDVVGEEISLDSVKRALRGADGDVHIALNHILADMEKKAQEQFEEEKKESRSLTEKIDGLLSGLAEEVKCPLCLSYLNHPVVLNCVHTYCAHCLEDLAAVSGGNYIECPLCRIQTPLDEDGVKGLNYNYYLANIVEKLKTAQSTKMCAECDNNICTVFCSQCKAFLCQSCNTRIHSLRLLNDHQRIPFEDCFFPTPRPIRNSPRKHATSTVDFVIPFNVKKEVCVDLFYSWSRELWFAPTQLLRGRAPLHDFKAVYIPFWLFEVDVSAKYSCVVNAGPGCTDRQIGGFGIPKIGAINQHYKNLLVCASNCLEADFISRIEPYKVDQIEASTLKHTEDVEVKGFTMSKEQAWETQANLHLKKLVEQEVKGKFNVLNMHIETAILSKKVKRLFVPMYITTYECGNQSYHFVVNGATAKCFGHRPFSLSKMTSLTFGGIGAAVGLFSHTRLKP